MNNVPDKSQMERMGHRDPKMTARYTHLSPDYNRQAVANLPAFSSPVLEAESQQISQQGETAKVVAFGK